MAESVADGEMAHYARQHPDLVGKVECLTCRREPTGPSSCALCDAPMKALVCRRCRTLYSWVPVGESGFTFLVPLAPGGDR
jgi:hypothetical protein